MTKFVVTDTFQRDGLAMRLCEAVGIKPELVSRLILDLKAGHAGMLYVETFAEAETLDIEVPATSFTIKEADA